MFLLDCQTHLLQLDRPMLFGRNANDAEWNDQTTRKVPVDNFNYLNHSKDTMVFGKKITSDNVRRVVRKISWTKDTIYDMYRHDYSASNRTPNGQTSRLYDTDFLCNQ